MGTAKVEELTIPLRALAAAAFGFSEKTVLRHTEDLLFDMPSLGVGSGIILGATKATAFCVRDAVASGHTKFLLIGGKPCDSEDPSFTAYIIPRLEQDGLPLPGKSSMTEVQYALQLLVEFYRIDRSKITFADNDTTMNFGQNMRLLRDMGGSLSPALEMYTLAGGARRTLMTARKELGFSPVLSVHNAYPTGVTKRCWADQPVARAHMAMEAVKSLGENPLYVRRGFAHPIDLRSEIMRIQHFLGLPPQCGSGAPSP